MKASLAEILAENARVGAEHAQLMRIAFEMEKELAAQ